MRDQRAVIIGRGEIGAALDEVLSTVHEVRTYDAIDGDDYPPMRGVDVLHICFPWGADFVSEVWRYARMYEPDHVVIHSTVPVGTSRECAANHSPCMGLHPALAQSLLAFTKFIGGPGASQLADHFRACGMRVYLFDDPEITEQLKLFSTLFYGMCIEFTKHVKARMPFAYDAWTLWNRAYNQGYTRLGRFEYIRPELVPIMREIGGHCVLPNAGMLKGDPFAEFLLALNNWKGGTEDGDR